MTDRRRTKAQLIEELNRLRGEVERLTQRLEAAENPASGDTAAPAEGGEALSSRRLLETVIDTLPHYLCVKDLDSRYVLVNRALADLFGETPSAFVGRHTMDFAHRPPQARERALAEDQIIFSGKMERLDRERHAIFPDGRSGYLHSIKVPLTDERGNIIGLVGIDNNITQRKRAEIELRESEERYRHLVDYSLQGIIVHADRPLFANQRAADIFGYGSPEELLALEHVEALYHPDERPEMNDRRVRRLAGEDLPNTYMLRCLRKDGSVAHMEVYVHQVEWKGQSAILCTYVDRTAARRNEDRFRTLVEGSIQGVLVHRDGKPFFVNKALAEIFGYPTQESLLALETIYDLIAPHERKRLAEYARLRVSGLEAPEHYEFQGVRLDGTLIWLDLMATVVEWDEEPALLVTLTDITERRKAEEERNAGRQMLQDILDALPLMVSLKHPEGRYFWANRKVLETYRTTLEEFIGNTVINQEELTSGEREVFEHADRQVLTTGHQVNLPEARYTFQDGRRLDMQVFKIPMRDSGGEISGILTASLDISELRLSQAETQRMAGAVEQAGDAIFITNTFGVIEYVNPAFERITGYSAGEALGKTPRILKSGEHEDTFYRELWESLLSGGVWKGRYINRKKSGELYHAESTHSAIRNAAGEITHFVAVHRDITHQIQLEEQLRRSQRMEALGTLTGGIAHDFNNILVPILGYAEILTARLPEESREQHYVSLIAKAAQRAGDLVSQILLFSRKVEGNTQIVSLEPIVQEVGFFLRSTLPKDITLVTHFGDDLDKVSVDFTQMHQVIMNLCVNAHHAMREGGEITIRVENEELEHASCFFGKELTGRYVRLSVEDTGEGIDADKLPHIFEPFYSTKEVGKGTGLGLSIVYGIVEQHGGAIQVESWPGKGSLFSVLLPAVEPGEKDVRERPETIPQGNESILLVDDEPENLNVAKLLLGELGYRVRATSDARMALRLFEENPQSFDLVITDHVMPELTGLELARAVRKMAPHTPLILYTGYTDAATSENVKALAPAKLLLKPYRLDEMGLLIRTLLDGSQASATS